TGYSFSLGLRQPLDLVQRWARFAHARADYRSFQAQRALALTGIGFQIAEAYANLAEARRRLGALDKGLHVSQGWLNAVRENIDAGTAEARDLVDAARSYYDLRLRYYQAIFDVNYQ